VNADSAFSTAAFPLHPGSQIADVDSKLPATLTVHSFRAHDPGYYVAGLEDANLEHMAAVRHPLGRAVQGVTESLSQPAGRIT
jgi:hypothetical protein